MPEEKVWLGTPQRGNAVDDVLDAYTCKLGGKAVYFREPGPDSVARFQCPKCKSADHVFLLCQLYAPLDMYDRVLYVLVCEKCTNATGGALASSSAHPSVAKAGGSHASKGVRGGGGPAAKGSGGVDTASSSPSFCFALRSQNFNLPFYQQVLEEHKQQKAAESAAAAQKSKHSGLLFSEDADWDDGDDNDCGGFASKGQPPASAALQPSSPEPGSSEAAVPKLEEVFPIAAAGLVVPLRGRTVTDGIPLGLFEEPEKRKERLGTLEHQLREAQAKYGEAGVLDTTSFEEDDETPLERCVRKYVERLERVPSQCVRWCPNSDPLRTSLRPITVPPCEVCGAARRFEFQITSPAVYFLTRHLGETQNKTLHFSNVLVYTCSANCYGGKENTYTAEFVAVEDEI